jgi:hypothetical protein
MDALDSILGVLAAATRWRVLLCLSSSSIAAFAMYSGMEWMTGIQALTFAAFGAIPGVIWDEGSTRNASVAQPTQPFVSVLAMALLSAFWGLVSSHNGQSILIGAAVFAASAYAYLRLVQTTNAPIGRLHRAAIGTICYAFGCTVGYFL